MSQEEHDRYNLNSLLDELERRQLYCRRAQLVDIVFSPVRKPAESWAERLQWLLMAGGFGFCSPLTREAAAPALEFLAGYTGRNDLLFPCAYQEQGLTRSTPGPRCLWFAYRESGKSA